MTIMMTLGIPAWLVGSFLAKGGRVLGKTVDQRCPESKIVDPSLLSGAAGSTSVKPDVFMDPGLCFSSPVVRRWKVGVRGCPSRCDTLSGPREGTMRSGQREQSCLRHDGFCPPETSGALVREQSSLRRVGVVGVNNSVYNEMVVLVSLPGAGVPSWLVLPRRPVWPLSGG